MTRPKPNPEDYASELVLRFILPQQHRSADLALKGPALAAVLAELDRELARYVRGKGMPAVWHVERMDDHGKMQRAPMPDTFQTEHLDAFEHVRGLIRALMSDEELPPEAIA